MCNSFCRSQFYFWFTLTELPFEGHVVLLPRGRDCQGGPALDTVSAVPLHSFNQQRFKCLCHSNRRYILTMCGILLGCDDPSAGSVLLDGAVVVWPGSPASALQWRLQGRGQENFVEEGLLGDSIWAPEGKVRLWRASSVRPGNPDHPFRA